MRIDTQKQNLVRIAVNVRINYENDYLNVSFDYGVFLGLSESSFTCPGLQCVIPCFVRTSANRFEFRDRLEFGRRRMRVPNANLEFRSSYLYVVVLPLQNWIRANCSVMISTWTRNM